MCRNVVLITLDSLRADHCGIYGYHRCTTPTIDKMGRHGLLFLNAVSTSVPTGPSMFTLFTGKFCPVSSDVFVGEVWRKHYRNSLTLADIFKRNGYFTAAVHTNPYVSRYFGVNKGFIHFNDFIESSQLNALVSSSRIYVLFCNIKKLIKNEGTNTPWEKYYEHILKITQLSKGRPYFLWVLLLDTHTPYLPPNKKWCRCSNLRLMYYYWKLEKRNWCGTASEFTRVIDAYDDEIYYADRFIKSLYSDLKSTDPIFIIHADHGDGFGEHGFYRHPPKLYDELVHVPLIIFNSDLKGNMDSPISLKDLYYIIPKLALYKSADIGCIPNKFYTISKVITKLGCIRCIRTKKWKFILGQKSVPELYNLSVDPTEQNNVYSQYPNLVHEFKKLIKRKI